MLGRRGVRMYMGDKWMGDLLDGRCLLRSMLGYRMQ